MSIGRPGKKFDTGEKGRILKKNRHPQARDEFVWLRRPEI
jgi:hypothetical protein